MIAFPLITSTFVHFKLCLSVPLSIIWICENMHVTKKKLVAFCACHDLYHQSALSVVLLTDVSCLFFSSDLTGPRVILWQKLPLALHSARQLNYSSFAKYNLFPSPCLLYTHTSTETHTETHGWLETAVLPATSSLSFPPLSPWRQASRAGWLQTVVNQHRQKGKRRERRRGGLFVFKHD